MNDRARCCISKRRYSTLSEAQTFGQHAYRCPYSGRGDEHYHSTGKVRISLDNFVISQRDYEKIKRAIDNE